MSWWCCARARLRSPARRARLPGHPNSPNCSASEPALEAPMTEESNTTVPVDAGSLAGRVAIVTGAGSRGDGIGNGRAAAILLARRGARVLLIDRNGQWAERTRAMVEAEGNEARVVECDICD